MVENCETTWSVFRLLRICVKSWKCLCNFLSVFICIIKACSNFCSPEKLAWIMYFAQINMFVQSTKVYPGVMCHHHRELILDGKCDKAPVQKIKQFIYQLAEYIQLKPVQATKIHLVASICVHCNMK